MSKPAATIVSSCELHIGGLCAVVATLLLLPAATHAAEPDPVLLRSDKVDVHRLGKASEDERSVLRMEWRAGLAGVDETRSVQDMLDNLRRVEAGISEVSVLIRNMPVQNPVAPVARVAAEVPAENAFDLRLAVANIAALALVALWWFRRRKPATRAGKGPVAAPETRQERAASRDAPPPAMASPMPASVSSAPAIPSVATHIAETPTQSADTKRGNQPAPPPDEPKSTAEPGPLATEEPVATASIDTPETKPPEAFSPDQTMVFDFSLEEADPEIVARKNAELLAPRPVSAPKPAPPPPDVHVEPTLQLAEIMLSMGLEQGAAQALIEYIEANPRHAVYHWLKLLGIYRSRGLQKEFTETAEKLRTHFNIQAEEWTKADTSETPTLEKFSRISEHVQKTWSQPDECTKYLQHLLEDNREGARAGFPQPVAEEILFLVEILKAGPA